MRAIVTEDGIQIPKKLLEGINEVEIKKTDNQIIISPVMENDPIYKLGQTPVEGRLPDASENHDHYLYPSSGQPPA